MSQVRIFFFRPSGQGFEVPVIPERVEISDGTTTTRKVVLGIGSVGFPGYRNTKKLAWSSFFPYQYDPIYCQYPNLLHPQACIDFFIKSMVGTKVEGTPDILHVKITDEFENGIIWPVVDDFFVINEFTPSMEATELSDMHYTISLETLRIPSIRVTDAVADVTPPQLRITPPPPAATRSGPGLGTVAPNTYTVQSGDSLSAIAGKLLGDMGRWPEIYDLNVVTIGADPDLIFPGQVLTLPASSSGSGGAGGSGGNRLS